MFTPPTRPTLLRQITLSLLVVCLLTTAWPVQAAAPTPAGTALPTTAPIDARNLHQLTNTAQWGRGTLNAVAFAPDGKSFVVGSDYGLAIYNTAASDHAPRWVPFEAPFGYTTMSFSEDGFYVRLESPNANQVHALTHGRVVKPNAAMHWTRPNATDPDYGNVSVVSPDGTKRFKSAMGYEFNMALFSEETVRREVYDVANRTLLYQLTDSVAYVTYDDHSQPEGCDIYSTGRCGNAFMALASAPYKAEFSPSSQTLAVMYRSPSMSNSKHYSTLRLYHAADGALLSMFGSDAQPVQDFAYSPDSQMLLVAFVNGSLQLWDVAQQTMTYGGPAFATPIRDVTYTHDGKYLLIQHPSKLEIRRQSDGATWAHYDAVVAALSPVANTLALADSDSTITLRDVNTGQVLREIQAHNDTIFALAFSPDGQLLASSSQDCTIRLWDVATGQFLHLFEETIVNAYDEPDLASRIFIRSLHFIPGANALIGFGSWGTVVNWNVNSGATRFVIESAPLEYYNGMMTLDPHFPAFFNVAVAASRFYINEQMYDLQTGESLGEYQRPTALPKGCAPGGTLSADGTLLFTSGFDTNVGRVCVLDAYDHSLVQTLTILPAESRDAVALSALALSPDGTQLAVSTWSGMLYLYQAVP